jgi:hypothetical protein
MDWLYSLDKIKVLGKTIRIKYEESHDFFPDTDPALKDGLYDTTEQRIHLVRHLGPEKMLETLIHETIHVIEGEMYFSLSEENVCRVAAGLQAVIVDNFELRRKE